MTEQIAVENLEPGRKEREGLEAFRGEIALVKLNSDPFDLREVDPGKLDDRDRQLYESLRSLEPADNQSQWKDLLTELDKPSTEQNSELFRFWLREEYTKKDLQFQLEGEEEEPELKWKEPEPPASRESEEIRQEAANTSELIVYHGRKYLDKLLHSGSITRDAFEFYNYWLERGEYFRQGREQSFYEFIKQQTRFIRGPESDEPYALRALIEKALRLFREDVAERKDRPDKLAALYREIKPEWLTGQDMAWWQKFISLKSPRDPGRDSFGDEIADYTDELHAKQAALKKGKKDTSVVYNSRLFIHAITNEHTGRVLGREPAKKAA